MWVFLTLIISGDFAAKFGIRYLFLDPEYLGEGGGEAFFFLGLAFGCFFLTWNLTTYLLSAQFFPFLASLAHPFSKFCLNNLVLPLSFSVFYFFSVVFFQGIFNEVASAHLFRILSGYMGGFVSMLFLYFLYFRFTNRDIRYFTKKDQQDQPELAIVPGRRDIDLEYIKQDKNRWRVDTYLNESFRSRLVRSVAHYDSKLLMGIFRQNHLNALIIQLATILIIMLLGLLTDNPMFRIPAGASILFLFSILTAIIGAVTYWFNQWRVTIITLMLLLVNMLTSNNLGHYGNKAYGLNYQSNLTDYNYQKLRNLVMSDQVEIDKAATMAILEKWKEKAWAATGKKPTMVLLSVSGGGLRSATWSMKVIQEADSLLGGKLFQNTVLITGASGGMLGMAYLRELYWRHKRGDTLEYYDEEYIDDISKDLLNPIAFTLVANDLFLPRSQFELGGHAYYKDRAYVFERQLNENTQMWMDRAISEYREAEKEADIPMLYVTPAIVNDARRMIISPQGVSFMMIAPVGTAHDQTVEVDAVDFGWLFKDQGADSLRFSTALRMNATYPYILPNVHLPSDPKIEVMDAGFRDNYGLLSATRFLQVFRHWIMENTGGVVLVQIGSSEKIKKIKSSDRKGMVSSLLNPVEIAANLLSLQEFEHDNSLGFIYDLYGPEFFQLIRFMYHPGRNNKIMASISFHLTEREKEVVLEAIEEPENKASMKRLIESLGYVTATPPLGVNMDNQKDE
ncbi:MAG: patatin-like phospholipase family protein [Saprospiraceae bacterium]|nr:patatin-like phospholipase family protein [Saprospiraceae bacterium]